MEEATVEKIIHGWLLSKELPANALSEEDDNASQHFDCDKDDNSSDMGRLLEAIVHTNNTITDGGSTAPLYC